MSALGSVGRLVATWVALVGCGSAPASPPQTLTPAHLQGEIDNPPTAEQIAYGRMATIALDQARVMYSGRKIGLYQSEDASTPLYNIVRQVLDNQPFREVQPGEAKVACTQARQRGVRNPSATTATCAFDIVDVLMQVTSVQIKGDSGYVSGYFTEVINSDRPKATVFCFITAWRDGSWTESRYVNLDDPKKCVSGRKR